ncbi:hypothetical protein [Pedobacter sp.]|uniref:hypothetical protein n=1 Tax=Pedobacter sp. TaxID=1411316 RepID=UPI003BAB37C2
MRNTLRFFGLLDIISIFLLAKPVWDLVTHLNEIPDQFLSQARVILTIPLFISLFISATGLMLLKKFGLITYYLQFPFRLVVWVFSFGFITLLPEWLNLGDAWFGILFKVCFITEFFRLYFSIKAHQKGLYNY